MPFRSVSMRRKSNAFRMPMLGHFKKHGSEPKQFVREFRLPDGTTSKAQLI